jgi:hypothetical protein
MKKGRFITYLCDKLDVWCYSITRYVVTPRNGRAMHAVVAAAAAAAAAVRTDIARAASISSSLDLLIAV